MINEKNFKTWVFQIYTQQDNQTSEKVVLKKKKEKKIVKALSSKLPIYMYINKCLA